MLRRLALTRGFAALLLACSSANHAGSAGSAGGGAGGGTATGGSGGTVADAAMGGSGGSTANLGYPAGPYGTSEGDVLADLELEGYLRDETTGFAYEASFGPIRFSDIRKSTQKSYAVFHVSGFT